MRKAIIYFCLILPFVLGCEESESQKISELQFPGINLSEIEDGTYRGRFMHHNNLYETEVSIRDHRIEDIQVLHSEGDEYDQKAFAVLEMVIDQQSLQVDSVTGATKSSKLYLLTIYNALTGKEIIIE